MTENDRAARNTQMLRECFPVFADRVGRIIMALEAMGYRPRIQEAYRSPQDEAAAKASGHSEVSWSFHNAVDEDGRPAALAVDLLDDDSPLKPSNKYCLRLAALAARHLCQTGILWGLNPQLRAEVKDAYMTGDWNYAGQLGWDALHVECADVTLAQAKRGIRPKAA